jgi:peptidoglycan/xylan/chitin deacetylase (PgdA/CDA1 family)
VIVGTLVLRECVISIPEYGTLSIHKRKLPDYRGAGPVGYWEVLAGEPSIGVTIHYATSQVDAGSVLGAAMIPIEECDTLESLRIKADLTGAQLYHETLKGFALGHRSGVPQDLRQGTTYRSPSELKVWRLEKRLRQRAATLLPCLRMRASRPARLRVLAQYLLLLPLLLSVRARLTRRRQAPLCILFYHLVANRPANHMCLPLEEFVRHVAFLRRYHEIVSLDEAVDRLRSGSSDQVAAAITFDDGYRENVWAIEYLRYFEVPAAFFVSIGHVRDGTPFEHDRRRGFSDATPMSESQVRNLASEGFTVGSHGMYHEDFGTLAPESADEVLRTSRDLIREITGRPCAHFAFPTGQPPNITPESLALAQKHYRCVYSAYGGYNLPGEDARPFRRIANPTDVLTLAMITDGYTSLRNCYKGNAWGLRRDGLPSPAKGQRSGARAPLP